MQATVQVLLEDGKSKLTTTRIAERAGVSVGTLDQYFPNKSSLLRALLKEHLDNVALAGEAACEAVRGASPARMAEAITSAFVQAKFRYINASVALSNYIASEVFAKFYFSFHCGLIGRDAALKEVCEFLNILKIHE